MSESLRRWPPMPGRYTVGSYHSPVAVVTLSQRGFDFNKDTVAIWGEMKTENLGIERLIINVISNPNIRYLIACCEDVHGHRSGEALLALYKNGLDENRRIIGTTAPMPFIENLPPEAVERFRKQVEIVDIIGLADVSAIEEKIQEYYEKNPGSFGEPMFVIEEKKHKSIGDIISEGSVFIGESLLYDPDSGLVKSVEGA